MIFNKKASVMLSLIFLITVTSVNKLMAQQSESIQITPDDYGKFGLTPFVGPLNSEGMQQTTLVFNKFMHGRRVSKIELLFFSSKKILILASEQYFECQQDKCFINLEIIPDYQYNLEFEFVYGEKGTENQEDLSADEREIRYRIKDIGLLTGRFNRAR